MGANLVLEVALAEEINEFVGPAALTLIWATFAGDRLKWRGVEMNYGLRLLALRAREEVNWQKLNLSMLDWCLEAA